VSYQDVFDEIGDTILVDHFRICSGLSFPVSAVLMNEVLSFSLDAKKLGQDVHNILKDHNGQRLSLWHLLTEDHNLIGDYGTPGLSSVRCWRKRRCYDRSVISILLTSNIHDISGLGDVTVPDI